MTTANVPDLRGEVYQRAALATFSGPDGPPNIDGAGLDGQDFRALASIFSALAEYSDLIAMAHDARSIGHITTATQYEARAERIYNRLPKGARW